MSLSSTIARIASRIESVAGVANVRTRPGVPTDRDLAEETLRYDGGLQRWTVYYAPVATHAGTAAGFIEIDVQVVAEWTYDEAQDRFAEFAEVLKGVQEALMDPVDGLPQIDEAGIVLVEAPGDPAPTETGHGVHRAVLAFHLLDDVST